RPRGQGAAAALTDAVDGFAYRPDPPTRFVHRGRCRLDWSLAPRVASSCELPQGRKAARVSELWRGHGESSFSKITIPQLPLSPIGPAQFRRSDPDVTRFRAQRRIRSYFRDFLSLPVFSVLIPVLERGSLLSAKMQRATGRLSAL